MKIELINDSTYKCDEVGIKSLADFTLSKLGIHPDSELSIRLVNEDEITQLHIKWMDLPGPTDVLSFPMDEMKPNSASNGPGMIGDIVLCPAFAEKNGKQSLTNDLNTIFVGYPKTIKLILNKVKDKNFKLAIRSLKFTVIE